MSLSNSTMYAWVMGEGDGGSEADMRAIGHPLCVAEIGDKEGVQGVRGGEGRNGACAKFVRARSVN